MGFTPGKAEQLLRGMDLQEKEEKKMKSIQEAVYKELADKRCQLILNLKPFLDYKLKESTL